MPKVSVILSSYNHEKFLAASIESVLNQTFGDFELLIFDDGSTDGSQEIIRNFHDERIKLFLYEKNRGGLTAVQEALKVSAGEYLALQHSDDIWENSKLERQVKFLDENLDYAVCFTQAKFIDETGAPYDLPENHPYKNIFKQENRSREEWLNYLFWKQNCFCNPSLLARNAAENFLRNPCLFQLPDYFMWLNLCKRANVYVLEDELVQFRLRRAEQNSMSSMSLEKSIRTANENYFIAKEFLPLTKDKDEFLRIFPEAETYVVGGKIVPKFAFAQLCLKHYLPAYQKLGLEILYDLLHNAKKAAEVKKIYDYDERIFIRDTGKADAFGVKFQHRQLDCRLYINFGEGFNEGATISKAAFVRPDDTFFVRFDCALDEPVGSLRFDPDDTGMLSIKLTKILVNGEQTADFRSNAMEVKGDWHVFIKDDPWFEIRSQISAPELHVEIFGAVDKNPLAKIQNICEKIEENLNLQANIIRQNAALQAMKEELQAKDKELQAKAKEIRGLREFKERVLNSSSWKITQPLRYFGSLIKGVVQ